MDRPQCSIQPLAISLPLASDVHWPAARSLACSPPSLSRAATDTSPLCSSSCPQIWSWEISPFWTETSCSPWTSSSSSTLICHSISGSISAPISATIPSWTVCACPSSSSSWEWIESHLHCHCCVRHCRLRHLHRHRCCRRHLLWFHHQNVQYLRDRAPVP